VPAANAKRNELIFVALRVALLAAATFIAYIPAMHGGFIWDDDAHVSESETLRQPDALRRIWFVPGSVPQYYPVTHSVFYLQFRLWGLNPPGYKIVNVMLHVLSAILVWRICVRLAIPGAYLAGCIFALHPVHVESVAWISELKNTLSGVFYLGAMFAYLRFSEIGGETRGGRWRWYAASFVLLLAALGSKTVTATLPPALLLILWWKKDRLRFKDVWPVAPMFAAAVLLGLNTALMEKYVVGAHGKMFDFSIIDRMLIAGRALWFYAWKMVWPHPLIFTYERWDIDAHAAWQYLFPALALTVMIVLVARQKRFGKGPAAAALFFAGTLTPALGFFDVYPFVFSFVADHFQYLASLGLIALIAAGLARLSDRWPAPGRLAGGAALLLTLGILSWQQGYIYADTETLWRDTLMKNPDSWMAHNNLSNHLNHEQKYEEALEHAKRAYEIHTTNDRAYNNAAIASEGLGLNNQALDYYWLSLQINPANSRIYDSVGLLLEKAGKVDAAIDYWRKGLVVKPDDAWVMLDLARALENRGELTEAEKLYRQAEAIDPNSSILHYQFGLRALRSGVAGADRAQLEDARKRFEKAIQLAPHVPEAYSQLGLVLIHLGEANDAIEPLEKAIRLNPRLTPAYVNLGMAQMACGNGSGAIESFNQALKIEPDNAEAHRHLALLLALAGRYDDAISHYEAVLKVAPDDAEAHNLLAAVYINIGRSDDAIAHLREALRLEPNYADACNNLGIQLYDQGQTQEAIALYQRALKLNPNYLDAYLNLGAAMLELGRYAEAAGSYRHALKLNPNHLPAQYRLALISQKTGGVSNAASLYRDILKARPNELDVLLNLGWILATSDDDAIRNPGEAMTLGRRAVKITGNGNPACLDILAAASAAAGQFEQAVQLQRQAIALATDDAWKQRMQGRLRDYTAGRPARAAANP